MMTTFLDFFPNSVCAFVIQEPVDFSHLGVPALDCVRIKQVHGSAIHCVEHRQNNSLIVEADGSSTNMIHVPLLVRTADCLSVFIYDPKHHAISLVHAGWRSTAEEIVNKAIGVMKEKWGSEPKDLLVALGPAIQSCCYEVTREFKDVGFKSLIEKSDGYYFDLPQENMEQLLDCNVEKVKITNCALCTCCNNALHSYRRDGAKAGRMNAVMMLKEAL